MKPVQDYYEQPCEGLRMVLCSKCREIKPADQFVHTRTRLEVELRNLPTRKYESNICRACKPRRRKPSELTARELHNRVATDDMRPHVAEAIVENRTRRARAKMRRGINERWDKEFREAWAPVLDGIKAELHRNAQQIKYLRHPPTLVGGPTIIGAAERLAFHEKYKVTLVAVRAALSLDNLDLQRRRPTSDWWVDYLEPQDRRPLLELWERIPLDAKIRMRTPDLLRRGKGDDSRVHGTARISVV